MFKGDGRRSWVLSCKFKQPITLIDQGCWQWGGEALWCPIHLGETFQSFKSPKIHLPYNLYTALCRLNQPAHKLIIYIPCRWMVWTIQKWPLQICNVRDREAFFGRFCVLKKRCFFYSKTRPSKPWKIEGSKSFRGFFLLLLPWGPKNTNKKPMSPPAHRANGEGPSPSNQDGLLRVNPSQKSRRHVSKIDPKIAKLSAPLPFSVFWVVHILWKLAWQKKTWKEVLKKIH